MWPGLGLIVDFLDVSRASKQRGRSGQLPLNLQLLQGRAWENRLFLPSHSVKTHSIAQTGPPDFLVLLSLLFLLHILCS